MTIKYKLFTAGPNKSEVYEVEDGGILVGVIPVGTEIHLIVAMPVIEGANDSVIDEDNTNTGGEEDANAAPEPDRE